MAVAGLLFVVFGMWLVLFGPHASRRQIIAATAAWTASTIALIAMGPSGALG